LTPGSTIVTTRTPSSWSDATNPAESGKRLGSHGEELTSVLEARVVINQWLVQSDTVRPHRGLGMLSPAAFATSCREGPK
jgi:transposase InsO family protein